MADIKLKMLLTVSLLLSVHQCEAGDITTNDAYIASGNGSDTWRKGVMDYYNGCEDVLEFYPDATFQFGRTLKTSVKSHVDYLGVLTTYNSSIISKGSKSSLEAMTMLANFGKSREHILFEWRLAVPSLSSAYRNIIWSLFPFIGEMVEPINDAISDLEDVILQVLFQYENRFEVREQERCEKISIEEMMKSAQILLNRITLFADTALNYRDSCDDVFDSLKIVSLIANHYLIAVQGTGSSIASELISESENVPLSHIKCFQAMDPILKAISTSISNDNTQPTREWLATLVEEAKKLNEAVKKVLGPFEDRGITVPQIRQTLARSVRNRVFVFGEITKNELFNGV